jgi:hypothetical protein
MHNPVTVNQLYSPLLIVGNMSIVRSGNFILNIHHWREDGGWRGWEEGWRRVGGEGEVPRGQYMPIHDETESIGCDILRQITFSSKKNIVQFWSLPHHVRR